MVRPEVDSLSKEWNWGNEEADEGRDGLYQSLSIARIKVYYTVQRPRSKIVLVEELGYIFQRADDAKSINLANRSIFKFAEK